MTAPKLQVRLPTTEGNDETYSFSRVVGTYCSAKFNCGGSGDGSETALSFDCEYDYTFGCNVFPGNNNTYDYTYVSNAFQYSKTSFYAFISNTTGTGSFYPTSQDGIREYANDHSEKDANGNRRYPLYLLSANNSVGDFIDFLGLSLDTGQVYNAICVVFYDRIQQYANGWNPPLDESRVREAAVVHELGHGRGGLAHLCNGPININTEQHSNPTSGSTCIMADKFPKPDCILNLGVASPLDNIGFCGKCDGKLKKEPNWAER